MQEVMDVMTNVASNKCFFIIIKYFVYKSFIRCFWSPVATKFWSPLKTKIYFFWSPFWSPTWTILYRLYRIIYYYACAYVRVRENHS